MGGGTSSYQISAQASRQMIPHVFQQAHYQIAQLNLKRDDDLHKIALQIRGNAASITQGAAAQGIDVSSKSPLSVMAYTTSAFQNEAVQVRKMAELQRQQIWHQAQMQAIQYENEARVSEAIHKQNKRQAMFGLIGTVLGGVGNLARGMQQQQYYSQRYNNVVMR